MRFLATAAIVVSMTAGTWAAETVDDVAESMLKTMTKFTDELAKITDAKSFDTAKPEIKKVAGEMKTLKEKGEALSKKNGKDDAELQKQLEAKYKPKFDPIVMKLQTEMLRIATKVDPKYVEEIGKIMQSLDEKN